MNVGYTTTITIACTAAQTPYCTAGILSPKVELEASRKASPRESPEPWPCLEGEVPSPSPASEGEAAAKRVEAGALGALRLRGVLPPVVPRPLLLVAENLTREGGTGVDGGGE